MAKSDLQRRKPYRHPKPRFLIVCEGTVTEQSYLEGMRIAERLLVELRFIGNKKPKQAVDVAVAEKKESERKAVKDSNERFDAIWCVFDVDEHPLIPEARQKAEANAIELAISNPCVELWIYLHFGDQRSHIHRHEIQRRCRRHLKNFDKEVAYAQLKPHKDDAIQRARKLDEWQQSRGKPGANPSTRMYRLVEAILHASVSQQ